MIRRPLVVGNWKMELSHRASVETALAIKKLTTPLELNVDIVICPSFTSLPALRETFAQGDKIALGAQNVHFVDKGAWTGEVSVSQISPFVEWCIVGHSERRALVGETDQQVYEKAGLLLTHGLTPIICVGETAAERLADATVAKITRQVQGLAQFLNHSDMAKITIAYEPIWAIGTGEQPAPDDAAGIMLLMRKIISEKHGQVVAERVRILYGGSVKPNNITQFVSEPGVDGALVGGASVHPMDFITIIKAVATADQQ